jgi:predicted AlkP superfamily pyrophosphatase or phosphodiesterase
MSYQKKSFVLFVLSIVSIQVVVAKPPRLTMIIILDQFAHHELQTLKHNFKGGIKHLYENGISYENVYMPHALPETAVGHTSFGTGALPKDHGIIANRWYNEQGKEIASDDDSPDRAAVFAPHGFYKYGKSARNIMVDGLSDQVMLKPVSKKKYASVSISHKSRAALGTAGKLGAAFWLDLSTGFFTSSMAVCKKLPDWVVAFNTHKKMDTLTRFNWPLFHKEDSHYYAMKNNHCDFCGDWGLSAHAPSIAGTELVLEKDIKSNHGDKGPYELLAKAPLGSALLFDFAKACIEEYIDRQKINHLVLWVSCSTPDKIGHPYGPYSLEKIDILYHIDHQLEELIDYAQRKVGDGNALFVLTSDHGIGPLPEIMKQKGYTSARRIYTSDLVRGMNEFVEEKYGIKNAVLGAKDINMYLNAPLLNELKQNQRKAIVNALKTYLKSQDGIKNVWTYQELADSSYHLELKELEATYKNQLFKGRSGHLICQPYPYVLITDYDYGTSHTSPYNYDTHIPLIFYQKSRFKHAKIMNHVWAQQLPVTLAQLLDVPKPSASLFESLVEVG